MQGVRLGVLAFVLGVCLAAAGAYAQEAPPAGEQEAPPPGQQEAPPPGQQESPTPGQQEAPPPGPQEAPPQEQEALPPGELDWSSAAAGFREASFWVALLATLVAGAVGGVVYELLILQGSIERPHKLTEGEVTEGYPYAVAKNMYDLGIWARIIIGALAALAALLVLQPEGTFRLLATAVIAGSAGTSVFRSMQDRLSAAMAQKDVAQTKAKVENLGAKVNETMEAFAGLRDKLVTSSASPAGGRTLTFEAAKGPPVDLDEIERVERLLSETRGYQQSI